MAPSIRFNVQSRQPEVVAPARPTPCEVLDLSDLDNEQSLRCLVPNLHFYHYSPSMADKDPVKVIKDALARTLVYYFPFAGRLREHPQHKKKLVVDCRTELGAVFIEADADISIKDLGSPLHPPFPYLNQFMNEVPEMMVGDGVLVSPLLYVQVTRMKCGGFVLGTLSNNVMADGAGIVQFLKAISEVARGAVALSVRPVWQRELICARNPPQVTFKHPEFDDEFDLQIIPNMAYRILLFSQKEFSALRKLVPEHLQNSTSFELMTACLWRTRVLALQIDPKTKAGLSFAVNVREKYDPPLPKGFYGNAIASAGIMATAVELIDNQIEYALEKVMKAKRGITDEYMRSYIDELVLRDYPAIPSSTTSYFVSDLRRLGFHEVDLGWGKPIYGGPANAWYEPYPHMDCTFIRYFNSDGEEGTLVAMCLPEPNMEVFIKELSKLIDMPVINPFATPKINQVDDMSINKV